MKSERAQLEITTMLETARRQKDGVVLLSIQELRLVVIGIALVVLCILLLLLVILQPSLNNAGLSPVFLVPVLLFVAFICLRQATKIASVLSGTRQRDKLNIWPNPSAHADTQHQGVAARRMSRAYGLQRSASQTCPSAIH